jgi:hypothetical protein
MLKNECNFKEIARVRFLKFPAAIAAGNASGRR